MSFVFAWMFAVTVLFAVVTFAAWLVDRCRDEWDRFCEWNRVQDEKERRRALARIHRSVP